MAYCRRCNRSFDYWSAYHQHVRDSANHWECHRCQLDFESRLGLKEHYVQSPNHHYCQYCKIHLDSASDLQEHYEDEHPYCSSCEKVFKNDFGLHEHNRQKHANVYCVECKRLFRSPSNLQSHLNSSTHRSKDTICPFNGCGLAFINNSALILHLESGSCRSGVNRRVVDNWSSRGTGRPMNVFFVTPEFRSLMDLNRHLASPRHQEKVYRCPLSTCQTHFVSLSGLCQHIESERCGVKKFRAVQDAMNNLFAGVGRITI
ncbi:hypothetical protein BD769DRAFT_1629953 [Suillus cothurnatus]|nr:hypothetical protein BD769DRAFT_1629953 [Suillus cothurnatus]